MLKINKVIKGDCLEVMKDVDDKIIDLILCDLPYGSALWKWDSVISLESLWGQYKRIIKDNGAIVLTATEPFASLLRTSNLEMYKYDWVWNKSRTMGFHNSHTMPLTKHEMILVFSKAGVAPNSKPRMIYNPQGLVEVNKMVSGGPGANKKGDVDGHSWLRPGYKKAVLRKFENYPTTVLFIPNEGKTVHPTQKPVKLFEYLIRTYTNEGDLVLDNCAGSGTTGVACKNTNRNFILIEKEEKYCKIAEQRLSGEIVKESKEEKSKGGFFK
jgi:site-specific DNA-methyltransferase (adenine-specific)